jgi:hypothetical protein
VCTDIINFINSGKRDSSNALAGLNINFISFVLPEKGEP